MISTWISVIVMLLAFVNGARNEGDVEPCAKVQTSSSVVPLGSSVTATCFIMDNCPLLTGQAGSIELRLGDQFVPSSPVTTESGRAFEAVIPSFNHTRAFLTCSTQTSPLMILGGVEIRAGYPPPSPQSLNCQTNLTNPNTLICAWDPGLLETHLPTKYTLHTQIWDSNQSHTYEVPPGVHSYNIPRSHFVLFSEMEIYVSAVNELGESTSAYITLEPVRAAKFDEPKILRIQTQSRRYGCLKLKWALSKHQAWMYNFPFNLEVRVKTAESSQWSDPTMQVNHTSSQSVVYCRLLHGTRYFAQIRVRYPGNQSPWSEWSNSQSGVTLETAPTGNLDWWMRVSTDHVRKQLNIHLFWKPSKQFQANGRNLSFVVSLLKVPGEKGRLCAATGNYCYFQVPRRAKKVYLSAVNAAGKSAPTEVQIHQLKAHMSVADLSAVPQDSRSLLIKWKPLASPGVTGYVVERRPLLTNHFSLIQFDIAHKNNSSLLIKGSFEPYKPYGISVYPRFKDGVGLPQTVNAYSRQKAPAMVPRIRIKKTWKSHIELTWDEIPLDQRNGFIQSYKVFYWDNKGPINVVNADLEQRRVVLKNLPTLSLYEAFLMVSTQSGSSNGSIIHFEIEPFDEVAVVMIVTASGVGISLLFIVVVMTCFSNHRRLKVRFWPAVPDPANSSIKRWTSSQDIHCFHDMEEPNPIYLSHLSFLDLPMKLGKEDDDPWCNGEDTSDLGESICGSPFIPGYSGSNSDSVPYATVIFSGPCTNLPPKEPHVYLRSESTQPLLESEESFSPKSYLNMSSNGMSQEQCFFGPCHGSETEQETDPAILWDDFPFLRALAMNEAQNDLQITS